MGLSCSPSSLCFDRQPQGKRVYFCSCQQRLFSGPSVGMSRGVLTPDWLQPSVGSPASLGAASSSLWLNLIPSLPQFPEMCCVSWTGQATLFSCAVKNLLFSKYTFQQLKELGVGRAICTYTVFWFHLDQE